MRVLYISAEWPTTEYPTAGSFIVRNVKYLRRAGLDIDVYPFRGRRQISRYVDIYKGLHARIRARHYDLIHAQFGQSGFLAALPKRLPLVVTFHGSELAGLYTFKGRNEWISPFVRLAMQFVAYRADEVILVSEHLAQYLRRRDYHVVPGGLDLEVFRPMHKQEARKTLGIPIDETVVIFVAPPHRAVKRFWLAEAAMNEVDPTLRARLMPVQGVEPDRVPLYMNAADALILTSASEGSPSVIKEAMACNLPIVSVDVGDVRQRLARVTGCEIVSLDDPKTIARALERVLRAGKRTNGWEIAQELDEARMAQRHISVYEAAIKNFHARRKT